MEVMPEIIGELNERHLSSGKIIEWHIPQFSSVLRTNKHFHRSTSFNFGNAPWHLQLYPGTMLSGYLSVYIQNDSRRPCRISYMFSIKDVNGALVGTKSVPDIILADNKGVPNFFTLSLLEGGDENLTPSNTLKIVCNLKLSHLGLPSGVIGRLCQHGGMSEKRVEWQIPNFSSLFRPGRPFYQSPSFSVANTNWHMELHPGTILLGYLSLFLYNESRCPRQVTLTFSVKDVSGRLIASKGGNKIEFVDSWGFQDYMTMDGIHRSPFHFVPSDTLTIVCNVMQSADAEISIMSENASKDIRDRFPEQLTFTETETLSKSLKNFLDSEDSWDTLLRVQEKEFKVHRAILIARSSVFAAMFRHDMQETQTGVINISDCEPDAFRKFLEFLYTGKVEDISFNIAFHLYSISDKYDEMQVKKFCSKYMRRCLTVESFCDVVMLATTYGDMRLLSAAQHFFNKNVAKILVTDDWKSFLQNNLDLANKFFIEMTSKM